MKDFNQVTAPDIIIVQKLEVPLESMTKKQLEEQLKKDQALEKKIQKRINDLMDSFETSSAGVQQFKVDKKYVHEMKGFRAPPKDV